MLLAAEGRLLPIRVMREQGLVQSLPEFAVVLGEGHVLLLIDGLELRVETADHDIAEAVRLDTGPVVNLVGRDVLRVDGLVGRSPGIGAVGADDGHELVVLVRDGQFRRLIAYGVDLAINRRALCLVLRPAISLEQRLDAVKHRLLGSIVRSSELLRALEHQVLEIVCEPRRLRRVVLASDLHCDVGLDAWLLLVDGHEDLESVVQRVDFCLKRIPLDSFILLPAGTQRQRHRECGRKE